METLRFTATWCMPCKAMAPIIAWAKDVGYNIRDIEITDADNEAIVQKYDIVSVPTFVLLKDGKEISRKSGAMNKIKFKEFLDA